MTIRICEGQDRGGVLASKVVFVADKLLTGLNALGGITVAAMAVLVSANVLSRYFFSRSVPSVLEMTEFLLPFPIFLGLACVQLDRRHLRVEVLVLRLPARIQAVLDLVACLAGCFAFSLLAWQTSLSAVNSWLYNEVSQGELPIPLYPVRFLLAVGSVLMILQLLRDMLELLRKLISRRQDHQTGLGANADGVYMQQESRSS